MIFSINKNLFKIFGLKVLWTFMCNYFLKLAIIDGQQDLMLSIAHVEEANYKYFNFLNLQTGQAH